MDPVVLVRELADAPDLPTAAVKFVDTVDGLVPGHIDGAVLEVLDELALDLAYFSPDYSWEDPSLMDEAATRVRISEALQELRALIA